MRLKQFRIMTLCAFALVMMCATMAMAGQAPEVNFLTTTSAFPQGTVSIPVEVKTSGLFQVQWTLGGAMHQRGSFNMKAVNGVKRFNMTMRNMRPDDRNYTLTLRVRNVTGTTTVDYLFTVVGGRTATSATGRASSARYSGPPVIASAEWIDSSMYIAGGTGNLKIRLKLGVSASPVRSYQLAFVDNKFPGASGSLQSSGLLGGGKPSSGGGYDGDALSEPIVTYRCSKPFNPADPIVARARIRVQDTAGRWSRWTDLAVAKVYQLSTYPGVGAEFRIGPTPLQNTSGKVRGTLTVHLKSFGCTIADYGITGLGLQTIAQPTTNLTERKYFDLPVRQEANEIRFEVSVRDTRGRLHRVGTVTAAVESPRVPNGLRITECGMLNHLHRLPRNMKGIAAVRVVFSGNAPIRFLKYRYGHMRHDWQTVNTHNIWRYSPGSLRFFPESDYGDRGDYNLEVEIFDTQGRKASCTIPYKLY